MLNAFDKRYDEYLSEDEVKDLFRDEAYDEYDTWQCNEDYQGNELFGRQILEHRLQELQIELAQEDEENLIYQTLAYL